MVNKTQNIDENISDELNESSNNKPQQKNKMVKITGMWKNTDKNGSVYLVSGAGQCNYVMLKNTFKKEESNEPDYNLYISEKRKPVEVEIEDDDI